MRVIERKMIAAIRDGRSMRDGNTVVEANSNGASWRVLLHGNLIAAGGTDTFSFTLAGWNTPTTRSRVNALLRAFTPSAAVYCKDFTPYFTPSNVNTLGREIGTREWIEASRFTGGAFANHEQPSAE